MILFSDVNFCFPVLLFSDVPILQLSCILVFRFPLFSDVPVFQCSCVFVLFFLFDLIIYVPVNNFSVMSGRVFLG